MTLPVTNATPSSDRVSAFRMTLSLIVSFTRSVEVHE